MNSLRNFFEGLDTQKNINNPQLNKVEKEVDGFVIIDNPIDNPISIPEQRCTSKALNNRNVSNIIVSGIKKITSGILDIVNYANPFYKAPANNKTPQQKAGMRPDTKSIQKDTESIQKLTKESMLSDAESIQKLTKKIKLDYEIGVSFFKSKKGNKFAEEITKLKEKNENLLKENEKLKNSKSPLDTFKKFANLCLISKNNAEILHNYICLAFTKASSDDGSDKQQILFQANGVAEKMAKKYENHAKNIFGKISNLEKKQNELKTKLELNQNANKGNLNKKISDKKDEMLKRLNINNKKDNILSTNIDSKSFKNESTEESSTLSDIDIDNKLQAMENDIDDESIEIGSTEENSVLDDSDIDIDSIKEGHNKAKAENKKRNKLINEQKKEFSKLEKNQRQFDNFFAQYSQSDVSNEGIDKEMEELKRELEKSEK